MSRSNDGWRAVRCLGTQTDFVFGAHGLREQACLKAPAVWRAGCWQGTTLPDQDLLHLRFSLRLIPADIAITAQVVSGSQCAFKLHFFFRCEFFAS